jgi:lysophospholipase L1-like esterase
MGDSYISGTAGRWRGNSNGFTNLPANLSAFQRSDTGADAYDNYGLAFPGDECFRSRSAAIHLGGAWESVNVACSNARTTSRIDEEGKFKPGIDNDGQLAVLADLARSRSVKMVAVSIGANDFRFGPTIKSCVTGFLTSLSAFPDRCSEDPESTGTVAPGAVTVVRASITKALGDIVTTMRDAGYADESWVLVSHNYPTPLPPPSAMRYPESGYGRAVTGGCPFYDADLDWFSRWMATVNSTVANAARDASVETGKAVVSLDMAELFNGRRLCEQGTRLVEETRTDAELVSSAERVDMIRLTSVLPGSPYNLNEGVHPNHLGQAAIRACLRSAFNDGAARSGTCAAPTEWGDVDSRNEPAVAFTPR